MNKLIDIFQNSGMLLSQGELKENFEFIIHFEALYALLDSDISHHSLLKRLPFCVETLAVYNDVNPKIKQQRYHFRALKDGRRLSVSLSDLKIYFSYFKRIVLSSALMPALKLNAVELNNIDCYIDISEQLALLAKLPEFLGAAISLNKHNTEEVAALIEADPKRAWYFYGDINCHQQKLLKTLASDISIQTNYPFDCALSGKFYFKEELCNISDAVYEHQHQALDARCQCFTCKKHTRSYLHHLYQNTPTLAVQLLAKHNCHSY